MLDTTRTTSCDLESTDISQLSDDELLEAVWAMESQYKPSGYSQDHHRRHLSRTELENVFRLVQQRARLRAQLQKQRR